jgi:hypothetical protein
VEDYRVEPLALRKPKFRIMITIFRTVLMSIDKDGYRGDEGAATPPPAPASTFCHRGSTAREAVQIFGGTGTRMYSPLFLPIHHWSHHKEQNINK